MLRYPFIIHNKFALKILFLKHFPLGFKIFKKNSLKKILVFIQ